MPNQCQLTFLFFKQNITENVRGNSFKYLYEISTTNIIQAKKY